MKPLPIAVAAIVGLLVGVLAAKAIAPTPPKPDPAIEMAVAALKVDEGYRARMYRDTAGNWTIGYGTNLSAGITKPQADALLRHDLANVIGGLTIGFPAYKDMPVPVRAELLNIGYQGGIRGELSFKRMLAALAKRDWETAAKEALDSAWARETPHRAERAAKVFRDQIKR